jgi:hypothetical protein
MQRPEFITILGGAAASLLSRLTWMGLPATPVEDVKLYFNDNEVADL